MSENKTIAEGAAMLRKFAEMTAKHSQNWGNFEKIAKDMLNQAWNAGYDERTGEIPH